jgi:glucose dehydrogenase
LEEKGIKDTGAVNAGGSLVTAGGIIFIGATNDQRFRAFDAHSGKLLWQTEFDTDAMADPMTYLNREGKQLVVITTGGPGLFGGVGPVPASVSGKVVAFALPSGAKIDGKSGTKK